MTEPPGHEFALRLMDARQARDATAAQVPFDVDDPPRSISERTCLRDHEAARRICGKQVAGQAKSHLFLRAPACTARGSSGNRTALLR